MNVTEPPNFTEYYNTDGRQFTNSSVTSSSTSTDINNIITITQLYVHPIVATIGLIANCLTFLILKKLGLRKPSNILMFCLTLADCLFLINSVSVLHILARFGHPKLSISYYGWEAPESLIYAVFIVDRIAFTIENFGGYVATGLPVLITIERFIATFFPLKFRSLVTRKRALLCVAAVCLFWTPWLLCVCFFYSLYSFRITNSTSGLKIGYLVKSEEFVPIISTVTVIDAYVFNGLSSIIPASLVCIGSIFIGVKLKLAERQRQHMVSTTKTSSLRTTRALMSVSLVFALVHGSYFILTVAFIEEKASQSILNVAVREIKTLMVQMCASCNFFVYIMQNSKYRKVLVDMFALKVSTSEI